MDTSIPMLLFLCFIAVMLFLDLYVFHKNSHIISMKEAVIWSVFWIVLSLLFTGVVYWMSGYQGAINYLTGYLIEKSLSVDNLFVFILIFDYFQTPSAVKHHVLFWGVVGAIVMRGVFIALGIALISTFHWVIYVFGVILVVSGIKMWFEKDKKIEPDRNPILKLLNKFIPMTDEYHGDKFFIIKNAKRYATPLFAVLIVIETSDLIFAVDSIPAILAITYDPFIVFTSNIFAILGLRSLYFVLAKMKDSFDYLHYGLAFILVFVGMKMLMAEWVIIPTWIALSVVFVVLVISVVVSVKMRQPKQDRKR
jgi:tellurite resistance protein TerC